MENKLTTNSEVTEQRVWNEPTLVELPVSLNTLGSAVTTSDTGGSS